MACTVLSYFYFNPREVTKGYQLGQGMITTCLGSVICGQRELREGGQD